MSSDSLFPLAASPGGAPSRRIELDNLIRRELRVGDPSDPAQVAKALMQRYADTATARSLVNEARGMPFLQAAGAAPALPRVQTATDLDLQQAKDDIEADLRELLTSNQLKDIVPELEGWAHAIRAAVAEGERSAAQAMDTRQRDKTFAIRRQLGDYARAARLVGSFKAPSRASFRNLAQSLDEAAAVLLVMMGEGIANTGIAGGRYLLQVPFGELQSRREAVLYALRNLMGSTQYAYGPNDMPRGLDAYRKLLLALEQQGQGELRSLLTEAEMSRVMDQLIDRAGQGVSGLRALASTAQIDIQRFQRLLAAIRWNVDRTNSSPPLIALQEALGLFVDGFGNSGGIRLVNIARPAILRYGLYRSRPQGEAERRLHHLLDLRGNLAAAADAAAECGCDDADTRHAVLLDQGLYSMDRAIDLYSVGVANERGRAEVRAAAHGQVIAAMVQRIRGDVELAACIDDPDFMNDLAAQADDLDVVDNTSRLEERGWIVEELASLWAHEADARKTVAQLAGESRVLGRSYDGCESDFGGSAAPEGDVPWVLWNAFRAHRAGVELPPEDLHLPDTAEASLWTLMNAKTQEVLLTSHVHLDSARRYARQLAVLESEARETLEKAVKKNANATIRLRITPEGEESDTPVDFHKDDALEAIERLHRRVSAANTAIVHLQQGRRVLADTVRHIPHIA